uniref:Uncharacterized protein n=1 Tax=Arundo donax TaxID=35708 RepID=A0A0A9ENC6_ARUDO
MMPLEIKLARLHFPWEPGQLYLNIPPSEAVSSGFLRWRAFNMTQGVAV